MSKNRLGTIAVLMLIFIFAGILPHALAATGDGSQFQSGETTSCSLDYTPSNIIDRIKYNLDCQTYSKKAAPIPVDAGTETDLIVIADHKNYRRNARIITAADTATGQKTGISKNKHHTVEINLEDGKTLSFTGLLVGNSTQIKYERLNDTGLANSFAIDLSGLNFTTATITAVAQQPELYKCKEWDFAAQTCNGSWVKLMDIAPGSEYSITLTADDPGFGEYNSSTANAEQTTTSTTPQNATQLNFTPTISQYLLIGFGEINHNGTANDARSRLLLNGTQNIGNLSWEPVQTYDYTPFFTHTLVNLNTNQLQKLNVQFWTEAAAAFTMIRRATAVSLGIKDSDAVTNSSGYTAQALIPAGTYHSVVNLSYTPTINQLLLVVASAELLPNKTNESITARLLQNGTDRSFVDIEGKDITDVVLFATHLVVNATANVQQNFTLQALAEIAPDKSIRNARITIVPLNESVFYNETEALSSTTSATQQNKTFLFFTLPEPRDVLIIGSAKVNISNAAAANSLNALLFLDEAPIGNMTKNAKDVLDDYAFIAVQQTNLSAGAHSLRIAFSRNGTAGTVGIANSRITVITLPKPAYNTSNISITKTDSPDPVNASTNLTYRINVSSTGNGTAFNVIVNDTYPAQAIYLASQPAPVSGTNNTWLLSSIPNGTSMLVNITLLVRNIINGAVINNTANVTWQNATGGSFSLQAATSTTVLSVPIINQVVLNSTNPLTNFSSENLTVYVTNSTYADGAVVQNITDWRVNNRSIAVLNMLFEGGSNNTFTRDYSIYGNNGSVRGAGWTASGGYGGSGAYLFNGINSSINIGQPESLNFNGFANFTISAWVNVAANTGTHRPILCKGDYQYCLKPATGNTFEFCVYDTTWKCVYSDSVITPNMWYYVVAETNGANLSMFVNGVKQAQTNTHTGISTDAYNVTIGWDGQLAGRYFNGTIDNVHIWNRTLSAEQIWALYTNRTDLIVSQELVAGEIWQACVTPNDNQQDGNTVCSNNVTIRTPFLRWSNPSANETTIYWNSSIRFNTTWTSEVSLSGYIFSINQSGWQSSSFVPFGGLTNESWNISTITADAGSVVGWYFWANNSAGYSNQTSVQNFTVQPRPTTLVFSVNQTVYPQGYGSLAATQYYIPLNARFTDTRTGQPVSGASCNATNNETSEIITLDYNAATGNYTGNLSTYLLYDNVTLSAACAKQNYASNSNQTSAKVWFITYLWEDGNRSFDQASTFTTFLSRDAASGGLFTKTINTSLVQGDNLVQEFNYCGSGTNCSLARDYLVTNGVFSMKLNISINDTVCRPYLCYFFKDPAFNKIYEDCYSTPTAIPANTATIVENNITDTHTLPQGNFIGISLYLNCSSAVSEQVKVYYNYTGEPASFIITHPKPVEIITSIPFSAQVEKNYTIGPNRRINETRMAVITFNNTASTPTYTDYIFIPRIYAAYQNSVIPNTTYVYNSTGQLWASDNASAGAPGVATVYSNNQISWRTETIPNGTLKNESTYSVLLDCVRDDEYLGLNTTTDKAWNISVYSILTSVVSTQNLTVWTNYTAYGDIESITYAANITNSTGTFDITGITIINTTTTTLTFPNLTLVANATIRVAITGQPRQRPYVKIVYPFNLAFNVRTSVPIVANISDPLGIILSYANVTLPNGTKRNATFGRVQQPDSFDRNTMNTSWFTEAAIGTAQTCYLGINESVPGMALTGVSGNGWPYTLGLCSIISKSIVYGDFDTNISFALMNPMQNDTAIVFGFSETPTGVNASRTAYITLAKRTGVGEIYLSYANDGNITGFISTRFSDDTFGKFRIKRSGANFTFYSWNNTGSAWITEASSSLNMSSVLYLLFASGNNLPAFGALNASWDNFSINTFNYSVAFVNETNTTGVYNVTAIAVNNIGGINNTEKTNFTIAVINHPPSIPYILLPAMGQVVYELFNITWMQVSDQEDNNLQFNITLLNPNGTFNATIVSNYGNSTTTSYPWDPTGYPNGDYKLKVTVFENDTIEKYATSDTMLGNFTLGHMPTVVVIAPINKSFPDRRPVSLVINATDSDGIDTAIASVTLPNGNVENLTMGSGQVSDNFNTDTMGTYWDPYSYTGPSQICTTNIDTTVPGKAYISLSGDGTPETDTYCVIGSNRAIDGDFDINVTFDILSNIGKDGILNFALTEVPDPTTTAKTIIFAVSNWSGYEPGYEIYVNDGTYAGYPLNLRLSNDTAGKLRIKRTGNNFTFYTWSSGWIKENLTQDTFDFARSLYISLQLESAYPGWGERNATFADFGVNSANLTFAIFNNTLQIGNYNVSFIVNDTIGITNRDAHTNFSVYLHNDPPSVPWILAPYVGEMISGLFNITWTPSVDEEGDALQFNITLLNADFSINSTITSNYGDENSTDYEWNTSQFPDGIYSLNVTVFETSTPEKLSNSNVLDGNFTVDNTPPNITLGECVPNPSTLAQMVRCNATVTDALAGISTVTANITLPNGSVVNVTVVYQGNDVYNFSYLTAVSALHTVTWRANDTVTTGRNNIATATATFQVGVPPTVVVIAPINKSFPDRRPVSLVINASSTNGIDTAIASVTLPDNSVENLTMGSGMVSDDFSTDTMGTYWDPYSYIGPSQNCITNIDTTAPGKAYVSLSGDGSPETDTYCMIASAKAVQGDFDINVSFDMLSSLGKDTILYLALTEVPDPTTTTKTILYGVSNWSGYDSGYEVYVSEENYTGYPLNLRLSNDSSGKLRIKRQGSNFSFYFWSGGWIKENLTQDTFDFARALYVSFQLESAYPGWGERNVTFADFGANYANLTFAIFNNTLQIGNYNVSFIVNDTLGITNRDAFTNFSVYEYNNKPSTPWILAPYIGEIISGLFDITWSQVSDEENNNVQFNITLLNPDGSFNATLVSDYGDISTTNYLWNTTQHLDGVYSLNVTVFENDTVERRSNSNVLDGNFTVDNTPPSVTNLTPTEGTNYSQNLSVNISAIVTDLLSQVDVVIAEVVKPNGQYINYTLTNNSQSTYLMEFNDTNRIGQYNVTFIANDTLNNINRTETTFFVTYDTERPAVFDAHPYAGYSTYLFGNVSVSAIATDNTAISRIYANITLPNGTTITLTPTNTEYATDTYTVLLLHLNEEQGAPADSSGNSITAAFAGTGYTQNVTGKFSKAVQFDGSDAYINVSNGGPFDFGAAQNFTLEAWVNPADIGDIQPIACKLDPDNSNTPAYVLAITNAGLPYFTIRNATGATFTATATTNVLGGLHHVAGVRDTASQQCLVYVDGVLEGTATCPAIDTTNNQDLLIGIDCGTQAPLNGLLDEVRVSNASRTGFSPDYYNLYYNNLTQKGRYNVTFFVNDTRNNINATTTTYFVRNAQAIIDLLNYSDDFVNFTIKYSNASGVLNLNITPNSTIRTIQAIGYYESSPNSILRIGTEINESFFPKDTNYTIDASGLNFTTLNVTRTATSGTILYKCENFNTTTQSCIDLCANGNETDSCPAQPLGLWVPIENIIPGQNYTFILTNATDPGFAEWNATQQPGETNTTSTSPVVAVQSNITPTAGQYVLLGYGELQGASNQLDVGALLSLNDTSIIGNASWQPDTNRTGNPPGDYVPFFTHQITNLSSSAQNLSVKYYAENGQTTFIRRARAINLRVNNSDALTNDSGSAFQTLTPAGTYISVTNLSFTPATAQRYLVLASAEVAPNSLTQSVFTRLLHNGTERAYTAHEGKATTDIDIFATQMVINASANVAQNFTLQAQSETSAAKQIRRARISAIPLTDVFQNESEPISTTTSSTLQNKTFLFFSLASTNDVLILGSADINISSCTNGNFIGAQLYIDGSVVGNLTQGCKDPTDVFSFITAQVLNLGTGSHTAVLKFNRIAGSGGTVGIKRARITVVPITPNLPPSIAQVILNTTDPLTNDTDQNLTAYFINVTDPDNDPVKNITDWRVNNVSITLLNMPFEGGSNATYTRDYSVYGSNSTVINATWLQAGGFDSWGAYSFNGIDSRIRVQHNESQNISTQGTWSFWIKINNNDTCQAFLSKRDSYLFNNGWGMGFQFAGTPNIRFEYAPSGGLHNFSAYSGSYLPVNTWTMLTFVYNANDTVQNGRLYVNGNEVAPEYYENADAPLYLSNSDIYIGAVNNGTNCRLNGTMDEVRIYNRSLSVEEIVLLYQNQTTIMSAQETIDGEVWQVCATPNDDQVDGNTVCSNTVLIKPKPVFNFSNISLTKTDFPDPVNKSQNLTYQINISSTGNGTAYNVTVNDTYSTRVIYLTSQPTPIAGTNNYWVLGNLTPGSNRTINITVLVMNITNGTIINNTVNISYNNETGALLNLSASINTTVLNIPPVIAQVILNTTDNTLNDTDQNLTAYFINVTDGNNDPVKNITDWRLENLSIAILNMPFEGGSTDTFTKDYSMSGNNGSVVNAVWNATGGYDRFGAYQFNGANTYINLTGYLNFSANNFTTTVWFWTNASHDGKILSTTSAFHQMQVFTGKFRVCISGCVVGTQTISDGQWHFAAVIGNSTGIYAFLDGNSIPDISKAASTADMTGIARIGAQGAGTGATGPAYYFNGRIDEVMAYNRTFSLEEIQALYNNRTDIMVSQQLSEGQNWTICVTPNDKTQDGNTVCSNNVLVKPKKVVYNVSNISVVKTDSPDPVNVSSNLTYVINVTSNGNGTAYNVTVNDTYPPQVIYLTSQPTPLAGTNNTWIIGNLTPATSVLINITVFTLNVINGTLINNTVNASFQNETGIPFNRSTIINTTVIVPVYVVFNASNISVVKTDSPDPVNTSSTLSYVINVTSNGNGTAYNVTVNDTYPPQVIYQTSNPTPLAGTNNSWVLGNLTPGTSILINITVFTLNVSNGTLINNTANASFNNETGILLNRSTTINTTVIVYPQYNFTNITITKTDRPDPVTEDNDLYYQINISSTGNGTAYSLTLTDIYPPEAYYVTALPAPDVGTNNTWSFGTIVQGTNISINITVHVPNGTTGMHINNTANITYQNETGQIVSANATANTTVYTFRYFVETIEHHFIRVRAGAVGRADLFINESYIGFNNTNPDELENITINATVFNLGQGAAANVLVMFWDGINCSGFQIGNYTISPNLQGGRNVTINMTYISIIGNRTISVCVDPFNQIPEQNKSNNNASRTLNVKSTTLYFGSLNGSNITLDNALNITNYDFGFNNSGNIYFFYSGSVFNFTTLQALGRNATGGIATDDFWDADYNLNSTFFNDSVRKLWANWSNSTPLATRTFEIYNNTIPFVPIINSTNNSIFVTGILWDTEGDTNGQYDTTNNETLVFVGTINQTYSGIVGLPYDYEIRIATLLRSLKGTLNKTAYIVELQ